MAVSHGFYYLMFTLLDNRPELSQLQYIMQHGEGVITKWYDIGLKLLNGKGIKLNVIRKNHPSDAETCCTNMFSQWLESKPDASWNQLFTALIEIGLNSAADIIHGKSHCIR